MANYVWVKGRVPDDMKYTQVYGIVFSEDGRILTILDEGVFKLIGGHPIDGESYEETLKREFLEEVNTTIREIHYLGYLKVEDENGTYAQVRMIAKIDKIGDKKPDPDNGKLYTRVLSSQKNTKSHMDYGDGGNNMLEDAVKEANEIYKFDRINENEQVI